MNIGNSQLYRHGQGLLQFPNSWLFCKYLFFFVFMLKSSEATCYMGHTGSGIALQTM